MDVRPDEHLATLLEIDPCTSLRRAAGMYVTALYKGGLWWASVFGLRRAARMYVTAL
jgi:hypothetical protein